MISSASSMMPSMAGQVTAFASAVHLEYLLQPLDLVPGLLQVAPERLLELRIGDLVDHLGQGLRDALLGVQNVLEGVHEEVIEILDRLGEQTHGVSPIEKNQRRAGT